MSAWRNANTRGFRSRLPMLGPVDRLVHGTRKSICRSGIASSNLAALAILFVALSATCQAVEINDRFLDALSFVESRDRDNIPGKLGEIGRFQISEAAFKDVQTLSTPQCSSGSSQSRPFPARPAKIMVSAGHHTDKETRHLPATIGGQKSMPIQSGATQGRESLTNPIVARFYARTYCLWLQSQLRRSLKREPSPAEIYCAYNLGFRGFERRKFRISNCPSVTRNAVKLLESKLK